MAKAEATIARNSAQRNSFGNPSLPLGTREMQRRKIPDSTREPEYGNRLPYLRRTIIAKP